jgi:hypothetical protein
VFLFFTSDFPPFLPDGFQCDTVAHTDETPCYLSNITQTSVRKVNVEHGYIPFSQVKKTHCKCYTSYYCEKCFLIMILGL